MDQYRAMKLVIAMVALGLFIPAALAAPISESGPVQPRGFSWKSGAALKEFEWRDVSTISD
jgi:hypothetical protein